MYFNCLLDFLQKHICIIEIVTPVFFICKKDNFFIRLQAQTHLGVYYTEEETQDLERAVSFFKAAAEQNVRFNINQNEYKY